MNTSVQPALVIMAAGMGSRFGGLKQITPVGPSGEKIIDYSIYDALSAGFHRVVFVIKRELETAFREEIGDRIAGHAEVEYVYQELDRLPAGIPVPEGRVKPWGTGHAVLCCRGVVDGPFMVINADDFYGANCYRLLYDFLTSRSDETDGMLHMAMAGYVLENTLTENGAVSRGICDVGEDGRLRGLTERTRIELRTGRPMFTEDGGSTWQPLTPGCQVSMNCWAFPSGTLDRFGEAFEEFLHSRFDPMKGEFYLPFAVDSLVSRGLADVQVLKTHDRWYGMTYREDREQVIEAIGALVREGRYPKRLWQA